MLHPPQVHKLRTEEEQVPSTSQESTQQAPHQDRKEKKKQQWECEREKPATQGNP
jgi:hypothetical protein